MDKGLEVISEGKVWKEVLVPGMSRISEKPRECSTCVLQIVNISVDTSTQPTCYRELSDQNTAILTGERTVTVIIGEADSELDKRIEMAIQLMRAGEKSRIIISLQDPMTGNETGKVSFEATLAKHEKFKPIWEWTPEEKYEIALRYKERGVKLFKDSELGTPRYKDAFHRFSRACKILITLEPIVDLELDAGLFKKIEALRMKLYTNMAACQAKYYNHHHVIELCSKVLKTNETNTVALFRRGCAYGELKDYERAVEDMTKLLSSEPNNVQAKAKEQQYRESLRQANIRCNAMVKRMFQ